ncbi:hypothetical protein C8R44DRAFT_871153 [Mycena epipterygia]|nr:hypothetical protein C8R44DRAFT_871153 [Mycena epipterygia]
MSFDTATIIDLLDELDLDIQGFEDALPEGNLLLSPDSFERAHASTSTLGVALTDNEELPTFDLLEEIELGPRKWVAAGPPMWDSILRPIAAAQSALKDAPPCRTFQGLTVDVPPRTPSRSSFRPLSKENLPSPTERSFARLRDRGSSLALRALNSALASPEIHHRVLI